MLSILIPDAESHFTLPVLECLARVPDTRIHLISSDPNARARRSRRKASFELIADDPQERIEAVLRQVELGGIDLVFPIAEIGLGLVQSHFKALEGRVALPPIPNAHDLETVSDKWRLAEFLVDYGIPHPQTLLFTGDAAFGRALDSLPFPVLIKPRHGSGGSGIRAFDDRASLLVHLDRHPETVGQVIVQSQVAGRDVDHSVLCKRGRVLAHTSQRPLLPPPHRFAPATAVEMVEVPEAGVVARRVCAALEWNGIAHLDMREDEDGKVVLLEINPRYWSSLLASHAAGVNFPHLACLTGADLAFKTPVARTGMFLQARIALQETLRALSRGRFGEIPRWGDTSWSYLLADPMPHLEGLRRKEPVTTQATDAPDTDLSEAA